MSGELRTHVGRPALLSPEYCRWWAACDKRRREDDHLSLVAGATRLQQRELAAAGIDTLRSFEHAKVAIARWVRWYNEGRPHQALGYRSPRQLRTQQLNCVA